MNNENEYKKLTPFKMQVLETFPFIDADFDAITNYELLCKVVEYLNKTMEDVNILSDKIDEFQNYFDNLDVQDEIDKKLDEMAESGELTELIKSYVDPIYESYETEINSTVNTLSGRLDLIDGTVDTLNTKVNSAIGITPLAVTSTSDMTDTDKIYVNTTDGKWYYYDGDSWEIGGTYQSSVSTTDTAGIKIDVKNSLNNYNVKNEVRGYIASNGGIEGGWGSDGEKTSEYFSVTPTAKVTIIVYYPSLLVSETPWLAVGTYDSEKNFISRVVLTNSITTLDNGIKYNMATYTIPSSIYFIRIAYRSFYKGKVRLIYGDNAGNLIGHSDSLIDNDYFIGDVLNRSDFTVTVEKGFINDSNGVDNDSGSNATKRARTTNYIKADAGSLIYFKEPYGRNKNWRFAVRYYDKDFNYIHEVVEWQSGRYTTTYSGYIRLVFSHRDDTHVLTDDEVTAFQNNIIIKKSLLPISIEDSDLNYSSKWNNSIVKSINHRGFNSVAPENTIPAFKLSKQNGFEYIECDVRYSSDHVPVVIHDETINRTARYSNGDEIETELSVSSLTYSELQTYDFGIYKGDSWAGTKIPSLEDVLTLCRNINLKIYIELKGTISNDNLIALKNVISKSGIISNITFIAYNINNLTLMANTFNSKLRLGLLNDASDADDIPLMVNLKNTYDADVFYDVGSGSFSESVLQSLNDNEIGIERWTVDNSTIIINAPAYVTGFTSNSLIASKILYKNNIDL